MEQRIELAVSTVIFALRPHPTTGRDTLWLPLVPGFALIRRALRTKAAGLTA